jgi:hypothetical protein
VVQQLLELYYNKLHGLDAELWSTDPHAWHFVFLLGCNSSADLVHFDLVLPLVVVFGGSLGFVGSAGALLDGLAVGTLFNGPAIGFFFLDLFIGVDIEPARLNSTQLVNTH